MTAHIVEEPSIDELDRRIIALLQPDGRRPFSSLAAELSVSEGTIRQRYRRLVEAGVLQVVAIADPFKIGYGTMAMIGINVSIEGDRSVDAVAAEISARSEVSYVVMSTGTFDLMVEVITHSQEDFARFLTQTIHQVNGVRRTETFMLLRVYKMALGGWRIARTDTSFRPNSNTVREGYRNA